MVYNGQPYSISINPQAYQQPNSDNSMFELFYNGIFREPSESMPDGIPRTTIISCRENSEFAVMPKENGNRYNNSNGMTASEVGNIKFQMTRPDIFPWAVDQYTGMSFEKLYTSQRRQLNFTFTFNNMLTMNKNLTDARFDRSKVVGWSELPSDFRKAVDDYVAQNQKAYANTKPGQFASPGAPARTIPPTP